MTADGNGTPATPTVHASTGEALCPRCNRALEMRAEGRIAGKLQIALACPRHGSFPSGWRRKFLDATSAQVWAARERERQRRLAARR